MVVARLFLGVDIPHETRVILAAMIDEALGSKRMPGRPAPPENWHLTLRFLGDTDAVRLDRLLERVESSLDAPPFRATVEGLGAFPNPRKATVLWAGIEQGAGELTGIAAVLEEAAVEAGFESEDRPYRPHLTLSRIRPPQDVRRLVEAPLGPVPFEVGAVSLFRSHLGGDGTRYEVIEELPLS